MTVVAPHINCPGDACVGLAKYVYGTTGNYYHCENCGRDWVISISSAYPQSAVNTRAPFYPLVLACDRLGHQQKRRTA